MHFDVFCKSMNCPCYNVGEYTLSLTDHGITYDSTVEWAACSKNTESESITSYPVDCMHLRSIVELHVDRKYAAAQQETKWAQSQMWEILETA